jgi:hypothetical protein
MDSDLLKIIQTKLNAWRKNPDQKLVIYGFITIEGSGIFFELLDEFKSELPNKNFTIFIANQHHYEAYKVVTLVCDPEILFLDDKRLIEILSEKINQMNSVLNSK